MACCRMNCAYLSAIIGILAGVVLGILYAFGFVPTGIIFWVYLATGILGVLLAPLYAFLDHDGCFCNYRGLILTATVGNIITAAVGLLVAPVAPVAVTAIVLGLATVFLVAFLVSVLCITNCLCRRS